jgi:sugar lactone lactonase YvrE
VFAATTSTQRPILRALDRPARPNMAPRGGLPPDGARPGGHMADIETLDAHPFVSGFVYGEGPRWHVDRLWFSDGPGGKVYSAGESGDLRVEVEVPRASGLGWLPDGTLVVSTLFESACHFIDETGRVVASHDLSDVGFTTNDLVVSPAGHVYVDAYQRKDDGLFGGVYLVDRDRGARPVATGLAVPNGLGFLPDGVTLVVNEMNGCRILAYPTRADGSAGEPTVFAELPGRHPDGLCVDADGAVWIGSYDTGEFLRVLPGGAITHRVEIETGWSVAPALGGADGRSLFLIVDDTTFEGLATGDSTGWVLRARVDVPGIGSP